MGFQEILKNLPSWFYNKYFSTNINEIKQLKWMMSKKHFLFNYTLNLLTGLVAASWALSKPYSSRQLESSF